MRRLAIWLAVLGALLVAADRVVASVAADAAARVVQRAEGLAERPDVRFRGFPFLTQAVRGRFGRVDVTLRRLRHDDLVVSLVDARLADVRMSVGDVLADAVREIRVGRGEARLTLRYADLDAYLAERPGRPRIRPGAGGRGVEVRVTVGVPGSGPVDVVGRGTVAVDGSALRLRVTGISLAGGGAVPEAARAEALRRLAVTVPLDDLPLGVRIRSVTAGPEGLLVEAAAADVVVRTSR